MAAQRLYELRFKDRPFHDGTYQPQAAEASHAYPFHYLDGVSFWMSREELSPDDDWLGVPSPEKVPDNEDEPGATAEHQDR